MHQESQHHHHCHCHHVTRFPQDRLLVTDFRIDRHPAGDDLRTHLSATSAPVFSWSLQTAGTGTCQTACQITVFHEDQLLWDSGMVITTAQEMTYAGNPLPQGPQLTLTLTVQDDAGHTSQPFASFFYVAAMEWKAPWIADGTAPKAPRTFRKLFHVAKTVDSARLYVSAQGLQRILLNGTPLDEGPVDEAPLDPPATAPDKRNLYVLYPEIQDQLEEDNCLAITVAPRQADGPTPMLTATLVIDFADGTRELIHTDETWTCAPGPMVKSDFHQGITFDERMRIPGHDVHPDTLMADDEEELLQQRLQASLACIAPLGQAPTGPLLPMVLPPVAGADDHLPMAQWPLADSCILDFGQAISGVIRLRIPEHLPQGTVITIRYATEIQEDGSLELTETSPQDTYIASGNEDDERYFHPLFTSHAFRYAQITGLGTSVPLQDLAAVSLRMDLDTDSTFTCSDSRLNALYGRCLEAFRGIQIPAPSQATPFVAETAQLVSFQLQEALGLQADVVKPAQAAALFNAVHQAYLFHGARQLLQQALPLCDAWTAHLTSGHAFSLEDYAHACHACKLAVTIAQEASQLSLCLTCQRRTQQLQQAFLLKWHEDQSPCLDQETLALCLDLLPEQEQSQALQQLDGAETRSLTAENARLLLSALSESGHGEEACRRIMALSSSDLAGIAGPDLLSWFYARLAGITVTSPACETLLLKPAFPAALDSLNATVQTVKGPVTLRWFRRDRCLALHVTIPFGSFATVCFNDVEHPCAAGFHAFTTTL